MLPSCPATAVAVCAAYYFATTTLSHADGPIRNAAPAPPGRPLLPSRRLVSIAAKKDDKNKKDEPAEQSKADFSAYWSLKFKQLFSARRRYLESGRTDEVPEPIRKITEREAQVRILLSLYQLLVYVLQWMVPLT